MKSAAGVFIPPVIDAASAGLPQWARIAQAVRHAAASGAVRHGQRLPSARQLAQDWQVSRGAVDTAFDELELEGLVERRVGDGTYLREGSARPACFVPPREAAPAAQRIVARSRLHQAPDAQRDSARRPLAVPPFHPRRIDLAAFPLATWRQLVLEAHAAPRRALLDGAPCGGLPALRAAIARHLAVQRGVRVAPEQVLVTGGPGEGLQLIGRLLLAPGELIWAENPSHASLPWLMSSMGLQVRGVPLDGEGLDLQAALRRAPGARLCYLHPLTQYPLGLRTSHARGQALLDWAREQAAWIVEGHMNDELVAPERQPPALFTRDRAGRTLMLGTFEGVAFPSLRIGYVVLPAPLAEAFVGAAQVYGEHVPAPMQWAMAQFIDRGHLSEHLQRQRGHIATLRKTVRQVLLPALPPAVRAGPMETGLHVCLHLPDEVKDTVVAAKLRAQRVFVECLSMLAWEPEGLNGIVVGYGGLADEVLRAGLQAIARTLAEELGGLASRAR